LDSIKEDCSHLGITPYEVTQLAVYRARNVSAVVGEALSQVRKVTVLDNADNI